MSLKRASFHLVFRLYDLLLWFGTLLPQHALSHAAAEQDRDADGDRPNSSF
jgi:hypothetical protein